VFASDFYIVQVEDNDWKKAARFQVKESLWVKLSPPFWVKREQLIRTIEEGYMVEVLTDEAAHTLGRRVLLVRLDDEPHFRHEGPPAHQGPGNLSAGAGPVPAAPLK